MPDKNWKGKGGALPRRSVRKRGKTCGRPFTAPRLVEETVKEIITVTETETQDSQVQLITETENDRDIQARQEVAPVVIPFIKGIKLLSEREADEMARHGEVLRYSTDSDPEVVTEGGPDRTFGSDTTGSTPDICKSPDMVQERVSVSLVTATIPPFEIEAISDKRQFVYNGVSTVKESEAQKSDDDSDDDVPIARVVLQSKQNSLTRQQIADCKDGPLGEKALGVTVAKHFDGVEYRGTVDSWRSARKRSYYHVTYTDGDEEELSQIELRDGFVLGLSKTINAEWTKLNLGKTQTELEDSDKDDNTDNNDEMSAGEGSVYDKDSDEEIIARGNKRRRKDKEKTTKKQPIKNWVGEENNKRSLGSYYLNPVTNQSRVKRSGSLTRHNATC